MHLHESVFWGIVFFLIGVFCAPMVSMAGIAIVTIVGMSVFGGITYKRKNRKIKYGAVLASLLLVGALYWSGYNVHHRSQTKELIGENNTVSGYVTNVRQLEKVQQVRVQLDAPQKGIISVTARAYPKLAYGDALEIVGTVERPNKTNREYLAKDSVFATMSFPEITIKNHTAGSSIKRQLLTIRGKMIETYERVLGVQEAALLAGITIGERASFDKEFVEQMKQSGTTHLVALSGYNISIVAMAILGMASLIIKGGSKFIVASGVITLFVIMAGAEASAVRAAIMGSIMLLAQYIGRAHSMRNAIAVSAMGMVLWNPNVLRYDLGFQLSFMALIGIIYVKPYSDIWIKRGKNGVLEWRENLSGTVAAQLAVFPIIMHQIGSFSLTSLASNILLLAFMPITMFLGFLIGGLGFMSTSLAMIPATLASALLHYEIGVIKLFGAHPGLTMGMGVGWVGVYYIVGGVAIWKARKTIKI